MADFLRIIDRLKIANRGIVYTVTLNENDLVRLGDRFMDLRGNHFKVIGLEMVRRQLYLDNTCSFLFEPIDGIEVCGNILLRDYTTINFLFCNHPFHSRRVDEDFEEE